MITIDPASREVIVGEGAAARRLPFASPEAFEIVSELWVQAGWDIKFPYSFTWMGRPIIQLPEDVLRMRRQMVRDCRWEFIVRSIGHG